MRFVHGNRLEVVLKLAERAGACGQGPGHHREPTPDEGSCAAAANTEVRTCTRIPAVMVLSLVQALMEAGTCSISWLRPKPIAFASPFTAPVAVRHVAVAALGDAAETTPPPTTTPADHLTGRWTDTSTAAAGAVDTLFQIAAKMSHDATQAAAQDGEVVTIRGLLRDALNMLDQVRDDALRTEQASSPHTQP